MMKDELFKNFVVFILSHGRPDNVVTYKTLKRLNYSGRIIILVDNLDKTCEEYIKNFGDIVWVFDKEAIAKTTDQGDNFNNLRTTTHVRNASFAIAKELGFKYFIQLDDDYTAFQWRFNKKLNYEIAQFDKIDNVFLALVNFLETTPALSIAMSQGGDFIGGSNSDFAEKIKMKRKSMNSFICSTEKPFKFFSRLNEDVNTYVNLGMRGNLFFTTNQISLVQLQTQSNVGGMTEAYLDYGTYVKSFYTVMYQPSSVKVSILKDRLEGRLHHRVKWKFTVPMIIREEYKKSLRIRDR